MKDFVSVFIQVNFSLLINDQIQSYGTNIFLLYCCFNVLLWSPVKRSTPIQYMPKKPIKRAFSLDAVRQQWICLEI